jgi:hypothetical protein
MHPALPERKRSKKSAFQRRKVEMLFAHLKRTLNFRRLRLRGMTGARDECTLAAMAQNLRKLVKMIGFSPPPPIAACKAQYGTSKPVPGGLSAWPCCIDEREPQFVPHDTLLSKLPTF